MVFLCASCSFFLHFLYIFLNAHFSYISFTFSYISILLLENSISGLFKEFLTVVMTHKGINEISCAETIFLFHF